MLDTTSAVNRSTVLEHSYESDIAQLTAFTSVRVGSEPALQASLRRITLALDLDETLIKAFEMRNDSNCDTPESAALANSLLERFIVTFGNGGRYVVFKRPGLDEFLRRVADVFNVVIFSAAAEDYLLQICSVLDPQGAVFKSVYSRSNCSFAAPIGLSAFTRNN